MLQPPPEMPSAEQGAMALLERSGGGRRAARASARDSVRRSCCGITRDLPEAEIASAMGISQGAVKSHVSRAMSALRGELGREA